MTSQKTHLTLLGFRQGNPTWYKWCLKSAKCVSRKLESIITEITRKIMTISVLIYVSRKYANSTAWQSQHSVSARCLSVHRVQNVFRIPREFRTKGGGNHSFPVKPHSFSLILELCFTLISSFTDESFRSLYYSLKCRLKFQ